MWFDLSNFIVSIISSLIFLIIFGNYAIIKCLSYYLLPTTSNHRRMGVYETEWVRQILKLVS